MKGVTVSEVRLLCLKENGSNWRLLQPSIQETFVHVNDRLVLKKVIDENGQNHLWLNLAPRGLGGRGIETFWYHTSI